MLTDIPQINQALEFIKAEGDNTTQETLRMCQIAAPSFHEEKKAEYVCKRFEQIGLSDVHIDEVGNVLGTWHGTGKGPVIMLAAHTDTVFPIDTDVTVKKEGNRYEKRNRLRKRQHNKNTFKACTSCCSCTAYTGII